MMLERNALDQPACGAICRGLHALVHQGVSIEEALLIAEKAEVRSEDSEEEP